MVNLGYQLPETFSADFAALEAQLIRRVSNHTGSSLVFALPYSLQESSVWK